MPYQTKDFDDLYDIVTEQLEAFVTERQRDVLQPISAQDAAWLRYLINVFRQLFDDWEIDRALDDYLWSLETWPLGGTRAKRVNRMFRLAGHVYLHVAFDLTRGLAGTVPGPDPLHPTGAAVLLVPASSDSFIKPVPVNASSRPSARELFQQAAPAFDRSLQSDKVIALLGRVSFSAKALRALTEERRQQVLSIMAPWVRSLRSEAWTMAERILDMAPMDRANLVARLRQGVIDAQIRIAGRFRVTDLQPFLFPTLSVTAPVWVFGWLETPAERWTAVAVLLAVTWWILHLMVRRHQEEVIEAVDALGEAVLDAVTGLTRKDASEFRVRPRLSAGPAPLSMRGVSLRHGGVAALQSISFDVRDGELLGIIGPHGAGKTSLLDAIGGIQDDWEGEITLRGRSLRGMQPDQVVRAGIARVPQTMALSNQMTVFDLLMLARVPGERTSLLQRALGLEAARRERLRSRRSVLRLIGFFGLDEQSDKTPGELSLVLQRRAAFAAALATEPKVLLLDGPMAGLNQKEQFDMAQLIRRINERHETAIIIAEHDSRAALGLCDRLILLHHGQKMAEGMPSELTSAVAAAYRAESGAGG